MLKVFSIIAILLGTTAHAQLEKWSFESVLANPFGQDLSPYPEYIVVNSDSRTGSVSFKLRTQTSEKSYVFNVRLPLVTTSAERQSAPRRSRCCRPAEDSQRERPLHREWECS